MRKFVPYYPAKAHTVTLRNLATHSSGIRHPGVRDRRGANGLQYRHFEDVRSSIAVFANEPLGFVPGSRVQYSSWGTALLSAAVEGASRTSFLDYPGREVLTPLGLKSIGPDDRSDPLTAQRYRYENERWQVEGEADMSFILAGGGMSSNVLDLCRFGVEHLRNHVRPSRKRPSMPSKSAFICPTVLRPATCSVGARRRGCSVASACITRVGSRVLART